MRYLGAIAGLVALSTVPSAVTAQQRNDDPIIVEGKRALPLETSQAILRAIAPDGPSDGQIPRFMSPACVKVGGLKPALGQQIADRIVTNAATAGMRVGEPGCTANILVMFVENGRAQAKDLLAKQAWVFGAASPAIAQFMNAPGPARIFSTTAMLSRDGDRTYQPGSGETAEGADLEVDAPVLKQPIATRIGPPVRHAFGGVMLVIDRPALIGKTTVQIADYATMRVLANARFRAAAGSETILALFEQDVTAPSEMTRLDRSLLAELYRDNDLQSASAEINAAARIASRP